MCQVLTYPDLYQPGALQREQGHLHGQMIGVHALLKLLGTAEKVNLERPKI